MLVVQKQENTSPPKLTLSGVVDETTEFSRLLGSSGSILNLHCKEISRINSVGIKLWRDFFHKFRAGGGNVKFFELSPPLVATLNYISDFIDKKEIASICAPFHCAKCNTLTLKVYSLEEAKSLLHSTTKVPCSKCNSEAELDEIPDDYLAFLVS